MGAARTRANPPSTSQAGARVVLGVLPEALGAGVWRAGGGGWKRETWGSILARRIRQRMIQWLENS